MKEKSHEQILAEADIEEDEVTMRPIKLIELAGKTLEQTLVKTDPFNRNTCSDKKCLPNNNPKNKISCKRNCICCRITCILCGSQF